MRVLILAVLASVVTAGLNEFHNSSTEVEFYTVHFEAQFDNSTKSGKDETLKYEIVQVETEQDAIAYPDNFIFVNSTKSVISPWLNLSSAEGEVKGLARGGLKKYEVQIRNENFLKAPRVPISPCHDSIDGFGGSTGYSGSLGISNSVSLGVDLGTLIINAIDISLSVGVSNSISASESISCTVKAGEAVQVFVEPWVVNTDYRHRTYYSALDLKKIRVSDWSPYSNNDFAISVTPAPFCNTGAATDCKTTPQNNVFLENGAYI